MSSIDILCQKIKNVFFNSMKREPLAAALMLGNLYLNLDKERLEVADKENLLATLTLVKQRLTKNHIKLLWAETRDFSLQTRMRIASEGNRNSITRLKKAMLLEKNYLNHLPMEDLIELGKDQEWFHEVIVALVRNHLDDNKIDNPFEREFTDLFISVAWWERNYIRFPDYFNKITSFPIKPLLALAHNSNSANCLLKIFSRCFAYFEISYQLAMTYPELRGLIAETWKNNFKIFPFSTTHKKTIAGFLKKLKENDAKEFEQVEIEKYVQRDYPMGGLLLPNLFSKGMWLGGSIMAFLASSIMLLLTRAPMLFLTATRFVGAAACADGVGLVATAAAKTAVSSSLGTIAYTVAYTTAPVFIPACIAGIGYMALPLGKRAVHAFQDYRKPPLKP